MDHVIPLATDLPHPAAPDLASVAAELKSARDEIESLKQALISCRDIGAAIGIVMAANRISQQAAFDLLRAVSQKTHLKLRDVAQDVVRTGMLRDDPPPMTTRSAFPGAATP